MPINWHDRMDELAAALADDLSLEDHETFAEIVDADGATIGLIGYSPLQLEVEISVVLLADGDALDELITDAHRLIDDLHAERWAERGFHLAPAGEVREGEVVETGESLLSYDRALTALTPTPDALSELIAWVRGQDLDFVLAPE